MRIEMRCAAAAGIFMLLSACAALPEGFSMYPQPVAAGQTVPQGQAILLVGSAGPGGVNYVQFVHSGMPAINVRSTFANGIIAIPVPVGLKEVSLQSYTVAGGASGYFISGMSYGYITAKTPPIDIDQPGVYFIGTLYPAEPGRVDLTPNAAQLATAHRQYAAAVADKPAVNFQWP